MVLFQKKANPFFLRLLRALFSPIILLFFVLPIGPLVYFAFHGDISTVSVKAMWFGACLLLLLSSLIYFNLIKSVITQLTEIDLSNDGLKVKKVKYDKGFEILIPVKEVHLKLSTYRSKNSSRSGEWQNYALQFFDSRSDEQVCIINEPQVVLKEILEKIAKQNLVPLNASEKDFLLLANRPEKFSVLKTYVKAKHIIALLTIIVVIYKVVPFIQSISLIKESNLTGTWKVMTPEESFGMTINFTTDSTATESVFNSSIKWKIDTVDSLTTITFSSEGTNGWSGYDYSVINRNDSIISLKRNFDERFFRLVKSTSTAEGVSEFKKMVGVCDHSFLMPIPTPAEDELLNKYLLDWLPDQRPVKTLLRGKHLVALLDGYSASYVVIFNIGNEVVLNHKIFEGVQGECSHNFSTVIEGGVELILNKYQCMEEDPMLTYYRVADNGNLVTVNEANQEPPNQWAQLDSFKDFPRKWVPLFEGASGLERQQLCGAEGSIEIVETDSGFVWREYGYQDVWEAAIQNFEVAGIEVFVYQFFLNSGGGAITEMNVTLEEKYEGVMSFNGKLYTKKPDSFPVNNNSNDCP